MKLECAVAIVTGGARGIGAEIASKFAQEGALVVVGDVGIEEQWRGWACGEVSSHPLDVTQPESVKRFVDAVLAHFDRIDVLINNAGIIRDNLLVNMPDEDFDAVLAVNLRGVKNMTKAVLPTMIAQKSGVILNASSVVAPGNMGQTNYAASKAAVESMTTTWAAEFGKYGIRVNAIAPGFTDTQMVASIPEHVKEKFLKKIPLGRYARPEEIAAAYAFLASDDASYITGSVLQVSGGFRV